jgi:uncharacterized damage-inducible protein DinB
MDRDELLNRWNQAWTHGLWAIAWSKVLEGLTPADAAWKPQPERKSVWQLVHHILFWREIALRQFAGGASASDDEVKRLNWPEPAEVSQTTWDSTLSRLKRSQESVAAAIADVSRPLEPLLYLVPHDMYHVGQIAYVRAMRGKPVAE